jgi:hypothetical protein
MSFGKRWVGGFYLPTWDPEGELQAGADSFEPTSHLMEPDVVCCSREFHEGIQSGMEELP